MSRFVWLQKLVRSALQWIADRFRASGRWASAALFYQLALVLEPNDVPLRIQLGHMLKQNGRLKEAEAAYRRASNIHGQSSDAFLQLGYLFHSQSHFEDARESFEKALSVASLMAATERVRMLFDIQVALGNTARDTADWRTAAGHYQNAVETISDNAQIWIQLGHALKESGDLLGAEAAYRTSIRLSPQSADARLQLGHLLNVQSRRGKAIDCYLTAIQIQPDFEDARQALLAAVGYSPMEYERYLRRNYSIPESANRILECPKLSEFNGNAEGPSFIWLSNVEWHFRFQRPQQLALALADMGMRVLYLSMLFDETHHENSFRVISKPHRHVDEIRVGFREGELASLARGLNEQQSRQISTAIRKALVAYDIASPVVIVEEPNWVTVASSLSSKLLIYDCVDRLAGFEDASPFRLVAEAALLKEADRVVVASGVLADELAAFDPAVIRNAADLQLFSGPMLSRKHARPILGYYGAIREWFAMDWIAYCARRNPHWEFWLIGRQERRFPEVDDLANVVFWGERPYEELPEYLRQFRVALIPFLVNELTKATNPVKLYEYLAAGKPVVATDLPEMHVAGDLVQLATDASSFERSIQIALEHDSPDLALKRAAWAQNQSWATRARQLLAIVESSSRHSAGA